MVGTNLLKVALITASAILEHVSSWLNWCGIVVFFGGVIVYAYLSWEEKQKKSLPPAPTAPADAPAKAAPTEKTKLVS